MTKHQPWFSRAYSVVRNIIKQELQSSELCAVMEEREIATERTAELVPQPQQVHRKVPIEAVSLLGFFRGTEFSLGKIWKVRGASNGQHLLCNMSIYS